MFSNANIKDIKKDNSKLRSSLEHLKEVGRIMTKAPKIEGRSKINSVLEAITRAIDDIVFVDIPLIYLWDQEKNTFGDVVHGDIRGEWRHCKPREPKKNKSSKIGVGCQAIQAWEKWKSMKNSAPQKWLMTVSDSKVNDTAKRKGVHTTAAYPIVYRNQPIAVLFMQFLVKEDSNIIKNKEAKLRKHVEKIAPVIGDLKFTSQLSKEEMNDKKEELAEQLRQKFIINTIDDLMKADIYLIYMYNAYEKPKFGDLIFAELSREWQGQCRPRIAGVGIKALTQALEGGPSLYISKEKEINEYPRSKGVKYSGAIALTYENRPLGVIYLHFLGARKRILEKVKTEIEIFGHLASVAVKNALLLKDFEALCGTMKSLTSNLNMNGTVENIARGIPKVISGSIPNFYLYNPETNKFNFIAGSDKKDEIARGKVKPRTKTGIGIYVISHGLDCLIKHADDDSKPILSPSAKKKESKTVGCWPVKFMGRVLGLLYLHFKEKHDFTEEEKVKCSMFAEQAALAIHNAKIYEELKKAKDKLYNAVENVIKDIGLFGPFVKSEQQ